MNALLTVGDVAHMLRERADALSALAGRVGSTPLGSRPVWTADELKLIDSVIADLNKVKVFFDETPE